MTDIEGVGRMLAMLREPVFATRNATRNATRDAMRDGNRDAGQWRLAAGGRAGIGEAGGDAGTRSDENESSDSTARLPLMAFAPALTPAQLGDPTFASDHGVAFPYMTGAMANGIASADLVEAGARAGLLSSFGAAGLPPRVVEENVDRLQRNLGDVPFAVNLIHSPNEPALEAAVVDLYLRKGVRLVEASAYLDLTPHAVRYRVSGIHRDAAGRIVTPNRIIAKVSRIEVATRWLSPPPEKLLRQLVDAGQITADEATLAADVPMAQDLIAEADSGGHTDNRPAITLLPTMLALRDRVQPRYGDAFPLRVGAAGGIATPASAAAAFAMGAAFVVTGSINQACVESGSSDGVRQMLADAEQADVIMAPAADMFEMGVKLQVLKRGTMFAMRGARLYELYKAYPSLDAIPEKDRLTVEKTIFRMSLDDVWQATESFFAERDPSQIEKARGDARHKMALVFRWYLGLSSHWANAGDASRQLDFQVWCGPAMGAFNEWTKATWLEPPAARRVADVAGAILNGAAVATRAHILRSQGAPVPAMFAQPAPRSRDTMQDDLT